jgi:hypothetical protein
VAAQAGQRRPTDAIGVVEAAQLKLDQVQAATLSQLGERAGR